MTAAASGLEGDGREADSAAMATRAAAIIPAGGSGSRMGGGEAGESGGSGGAASARVAKQFLEIGGEPILLRSIRPFLEPPAFRWVVVALPEAEAGDPPEYLPAAVTVVRGGATREDSVRAALAAVPDEAEVVLVHDAARPLIDRGLVDRVLRAAAAGAGALAAVPVSDTLKRVRDGRVVETVDRSTLWRAQTPQGFPRDMIVAAHRQAAEQGIHATDDAALVERLGGRVEVVPGDDRNLKVTRPEDLVLAEALLRLARD